MYRNVSSPIFDAPEFPTLRRVKPLPKRRKTTVSVLSPGTTAANDDDTDTPRMLVAEANGVPHSLHMPGLPPIPLSLPGPNATAEELLAHADALQSYYLPILDAAAANISAVADGFANIHADDSTSFGVGLAGLGLNNLSLRDREEDLSDRGDGDGDYIDHLQQPGNTKKRKVPANTSRLQGARDSASGQDGEGESESLEHDGNGMLTMGIPTGVEVGGNNDTGQGDGGGGAEAKSVSTMLRWLLRRRKTSRLSAVTLAGLQQKETLKVRKRQLAAVLGALSHGDTLALDQALSGTYPFPSSNSGGSVSASGDGDEALAALGIDATGGKAPKIRLSKRANPRIARKAKASNNALPLRLKGKENEGPTQVLESDFTFVCHSATADRLTATKQEVAMLRRRFETELTRQARAAHAASASLAAASRSRAGASSSPAKSSRQKRSDRAQQKARTTTDKKLRDQPAELLDPSGPGAVSGPNSGIDMVPQNNSNSKARNGKKKKRSALANASNPHHLRNYVPSRLPGYSAGGGENQVNSHANDLGPFPIRFLSAEIPPRRTRGTGNKRSSQAQVQQQLANPAEEWLCVFCEYELFFGEEGEYRKAVRRRKAVLKRRRRARERAAAAASGHGTGTGKFTSTTAAPAKKPRQQEEEDGDDYNDDEADYKPGLAPGNGQAVDVENGGPPKRRGPGAGGEQSSYG